MLARLDFPLPEGGRLAAEFSAPLAVLRAESADAVPGVLQEVEAQTRAGRWAVGFVVYEAASAFDRALVSHRLPPGEPFAVFAIYAAPTAPAPAPAPAAGTSAFACTPWRTATNAGQAALDIAAVRAGIAAGDYYQVNLTTRLTAGFSGDSRAFFAALVASQPEAHCAHLDWGDGQILSVSPELFFARAPDVVAGGFPGRISVRPMKGTASRHSDAMADQAAAQGLRASAKEQAENLMIVDLLRNDLARIAETGSVRVERLFEVEAWPTVWQMTSTISAQPRANVGLGEIFAALFPCGSVTGAPKVAAMRAIHSLEPWPRGAYCGALGVVCPDGRAIFSVGIRTVQMHGARAVCGVGSGITVDSQETAEYAEWLAKRRFLLRASASFDLLETLLLRSGEYWLLHRHLVRLAASAAHFGFSFDLARVERVLRECAAGHAPGAWRVRLLVARDGSARAEAFALEPSPAEVRIALAEEVIDGESEFVRHKTTERTIYAPFSSPPPGVFDTLLFNAKGELTEFTRGNLVVEVDGKWLTPAAECGLLPGVLRAELLAQGKLHEAVLRREDLAGADRLWFINSVRGMLPVVLNQLQRGSARGGQVCKIPPRLPPR
jgi:para-aminobenzoate synthetase / 4-amino-4-deoxychorismate lyase